jgi:type IV secretion system protein VirB6
MVAIATKTVLAVAEAFWATALIGSLLGTNFNSGFSSMALQQGGVGLLLTVLLISTPPMVASFFQGTLGSFQPYAQISGSHGAAQTGGGGRGRGSDHGSYYMGGRGGGGGGGGGGGRNTGSQISQDSGVEPSRPNVSGRASTGGYGTETPNPDRIKSSPPDRTIA